MFTAFNIFGVDKGTKLRYICMTQSDSTATIFWNPVDDLCGSFQSYDIYGREDNFSLFQFIKSEPAIGTLSSSIKLPNLKTWQFYIVIKTACNGIDSFHTDTLSIDNQEPASWSLDSVSVDFVTQRVIAGWSGHVENDVQGYYVYYVTNTNLQISDNNALSFLGTNEDPTVGPISYSISAYDSCLNTSPISPAHRTMFATKLFDTCTGILTINWTPYVGWPSIQEHYIFASVNNGPYAQIGTTLGGINTFNTNAFKPGDNICLFVRAIHGVNPAISSSSNIICQSYNPIIKPSKLYISHVSVANHTSLTIRCIQDSSIYKVDLLKRIIGQPWSIYHSFFPTTEDTLIEDLIVDVNSERVEYKMIARDRCNRGLDTSNTSTNVLLEWSGDDLTWNEYYEFMAGVDSYDALSTTNSSTWNIESKLDSTGGPYIYIEPDKVDIEGRAKCFCVLAVERGPNALNITDTAYSNKLCAVGELSLFFPTAFVPNGLNTIYKPVGVNISTDGYYLQIVNRWGEIIFETNDPTVGWDGTYGSEHCQMGVYVYRYTAQATSGRIKSGSGTLHLIRK